MKGVFRPRLDLICVLGNGPTSHAIKPVGSDTGKAVYCTIGFIIE